MMAMNNPNDPRQATPGDDFSRRAPLDAELQADPEMAEGPASGSRIAVYAIAVVVLLGVVFYGLNNNGASDTASKQAAPAATTADSGAKSGPAVRDVTPGRETGTTTGAAPAPAVQPPQASPQGSQIDQNRPQEKR